MGDSFYTAVLCAFGTALFWGFNPLLIKKGLDSGGDQVRGTFYMLLAHLISMMILSLLLLEWSGGVPHLWKTETLWLSLAGISNFVLGIYCYFKSIARLGASKTASIACTNPALTVILAVIFLHERGDPMIWIGVLLILAGIYLVGRG